MAEKGIKLKLDVDSHKGTIQVKKTTTGLKKLGTTGAKAADKLSKGFVAAAAKMKLLAVGITAATTAIGYMSKKTLDSADATAKLADSLGYNIKLMQEYSYAAGLSGVSQGTLNSSMLAFTKRLGEARAGTGALVTYLKKADKALLAQLISTTDVNKALNIFMTALGNVKSSTDRAALASAAFSRAGVAMTVMVKGGIESFKAMQKEAHDLGLILGIELFRNAEVLNDSMSKVSQVIRILFTKAVLTLAPEIDKVVKKMVRWVAANQDLIDQKTDKGIDAITGSFRTLISTLEFIDKHFNKIKTGLEIIIGYKLSKWLISTSKDLKQWSTALKFAGTNLAIFKAGVIAVTAELVLFAAALGAAYYGIEKLGKERLADWFGMPLEEAKKFRAELDKIYKKPIFYPVIRPEKKEPPTLPEVKVTAVPFADTGWLDIFLWKEKQKAWKDEIDALIAHNLQKADIQKDFNNQYAIIGQTELDIGMTRIQKDVEMWEKAEISKVKIKEWETDQIRKLNEDLYQHEETALDRMGQAMEGWTTNFSNSLNDMLWGADVTFADIAKSFSKMITQMLIQEAALKLMGSATGGTGFLGFLAGSEKGNVINNGAMMAYAKGGVVNSPTLFPMAKGTGLMGEAGPEAILPLQRGKGGVLGVAGGGGTTINTEINVSMDNSTTDPEDSKRAGKDIAKVIEYEFNKNLVKNLRPGGILNQGV